MSWSISTKQYIPAVIGESWGGGYFAGYISHTADGSPTHALIVAPKATGEATGLAWTTGTYATNLVSTAGFGSTSVYDGVVNMQIFSQIGIAQFPKAQFCKNLTIGGFSDWYLPASCELDIAYSNLKPTTQLNRSASLGFVFGGNAYAVPRRTSAYMPENPAQTNVLLFQSGQSQAFTAGSTYYCSSTESNPFQFVAYVFADNNVGGLGKSDNSPFRAFRRIAL